MPLRSNARPTYSPHVRLGVGSSPGWIGSQAGARAHLLSIARTLAIWQAAPWTLALSCRTRLTAPRTTCDFLTALLEIHLLLDEVTRKQPLPICTCSLRLFLCPGISLLHIHLAHLPVPVPHKRIPPMRPLPARGVDRTGFPPPRSPLSICPADEWIVQVAGAGTSSLLLVASTCWLPRQLPRS